MRQGTKVVIGLVVIGGLAAGFAGWQKFKDNPAKTVEKTPEPEAPVLAVSGGQNPAALPAETPAHEGTVASPPAPPVRENAERSFRARPVEPSPEAVTTAPAERAGLSDLTTPLPAQPEAAAPAPAPAPEVVTAPPAAPAEPSLPEVSAPVAEAPAAAPSAPPAASTTEHVVQPGETYSSIAAKYLGSPKYANLIAKANPGKDAKRLYVGAKIKLPPAPAGATTTKPARADKASDTPKAAHPITESAAAISPDRAYKVQAGESWQDLAGRFLHDRGRWTELYELNKERVPHNPQRLPNGTVIELPKGVSVGTRPS